MDNNSLITLLENRIIELKEEKDYHLRAIGQCGAKIEELESVKIAFDILLTEMKNKNIQENIRKNTFKDVLREPDDVNRINIFLQFKEKCGGETAYAICRKKMPKLETALYRKNRLWPNWKAFLEDYNMWVKREGPWANILVD